MPASNRTTSRPSAQQIPARLVPGNLFQDEDVLSPPVAPPEPPKVGPPALRTGSVAFVYDGHSVAYDEKRFVSLTQMWEAQGRPPGKEPAKWRTNSDVVSFAAHIASVLNMPSKDVFRSMRGRGSSGTWAHYQIAMAYAKYLSHEFHRFVNEAFREWVEEKADPGLKAKRAVDGYRKQGKDDRWIMSRLEGIVARNQFTDTLRDHGVNGGGYAICTDAINKGVLGGSAKEIKLARGVNPDVSTREHLTSLELAALRFAEIMAEERVKGGCAHGNESCCDVCRRAALATNQAMAAMGVGGVR